MPAADPNATRVVTGKCRLSYVRVFEPYASSPDDDPKYSLTLLIPKSDKGTLDRIRRAQEAAKEAGKTKKWDGRIPPNLSYTLHDGDEEADLEKNPEYKGHMYMAISSKSRPGVVDQYRNPIDDPEMIYSGCYGRVSMNAYPYNAKGKKGVTFGLNNVQFLADGERLGGGRTKAEDDFSDDFEDESGLI
jgi:hypothetical protein